MVLFDPMIRIYMGVAARGRGVSFALASVDGGGIREVLVPIDDPWNGVGRGKLSGLAAISDAALLPAAPQRG